MSAVPVKPAGVRVVGEGQAVVADVVAAIAEPGEVRVGIVQPVATRLPLHTPATGREEEQGGPHHCGYGCTASTLVHVSIL